MLCVDQQLFNVRLTDTYLFFFEVVSVELEAVEFDGKLAGIADDECLLIGRTVRQDWSELDQRSVQLNTRLHGVTTTQNHKPLTAL